MTSAFQRLQANEDDTVWRENASVIRQLYQEERKTLKEVKAIMENDKGFPVTQLSTWEVKLRSLGMQKKLKRGHWSLVYEHVLPRLPEEGKKIRKPPVILINGTKQPWVKCWKEMRRYGAPTQGPRRGPLPPLPHGVMIRSPSPELIGTTIRLRQKQAPQFLILQLIQTTLVSLQPLCEWVLQSKAESSDGFGYPTPDSVYRLCVEGIPFTILLQKISDTLPNALPSPHDVTRSGATQHDGIISAISTSDNLAITGKATPWKSQLTEIMAQLLPGSEQAATSGQDLEPNFDSHHYLSIVIYLLSNDLVSGYLASDYEVSRSSILEMTFTLVSRRLLSALFQSRLPSIKAAWEKLLHGAGVLENKEAFRFLISVGMNNDWVNGQDRGYDYLYFAARMNCSDILHALLARGCRPDSFSTWCEDESIIVEALRNGNLDCAKLLIQHCDVNHELRTREDHKSTTFSRFIIDFDDTNPDHLECLRLFLGQGADVDYEFQKQHGRYWHHHAWYWGQVREFEKHWRLSILDYLSYFHHGLFLELAVYCQIPSRFSRARALWHLDQGVDVLRRYLASDLESPRFWGEATGDNMNKANTADQRNYCLGILLAEQFLLISYGPEAKFCWKAVEGLSQLDIDLTWLSQMKGLAANMLYATARFIIFGEGPDREQGLQILQWLLDQGFQVKADALTAAAGDDECAVLECLASVCSDFAKEGGESLVYAVWNDQFDAIKRFLDMGVNPNAINDLGRNVFEQAACTSSLGMMKHLVQRGAKPRTSEQGGHPYHVLMEMFKSHMDDHDDMFNKVQYIMEEHITIHEPSCPSAHLLEMCISKAYDDIEQRRTVFNFLLKKRARLSPGSPLAEWIASGGGHQLVQEMLDAGADPNAHSFGQPRMTPLQAAAGIGDYTLVHMLLERGADLNQPALGYDSMTALQAICAWDPIRREERLRKDEIIKLFLDRGVDVNAADCDGKTALHYAAQLGDLSTAFCLLKYGAKVNMAKGLYWSPPETALDTAACHGRLDMVDFLLNANALSASACSEGKDYDRAIELAREWGHFVVSELICKHAADHKRWDVQHEQAVARGINPESTPQSLPLRFKPETASWSHADGRLTPSESLQNFAFADKINGPKYVLDEGMSESGAAASKAKGKGMPGTEATDMSWTRVIEEIEDEPPLADAGREMPNGEKSSGKASQTSGAREASSGPGGWLYQLTDQNWVEDEQHNAIPHVPTSLTTDVFMGFSEFISL